jgi:hypothetical protein
MTKLVEAVGRLNQQIAGRIRPLLKNEDRKSTSMEMLEHKHN